MIEIDVVKSKSKEKYAMVCPKCKYGDIRQDKSTLQQMGALPTMYICNKCGHSGYTFPEVKVSEIKDFEQEVDDKKLRTLKKDETDLIDTALGKNAVRVVWKFTSILAILIGLGDIIFLQKFGTVFILVNTVVLLLGIGMFYITYFKSKKKA